MAQPKTSEPTLPDSLKVTFLNPEEHHAFLDASYWTRITGTEIVREAVRREVKRLAKIHNKGLPFARRPR
jgi:hypothetical protein